MFIIVLLVALCSIVSALQMSIPRDVVLRPFREGNAFKVIAGLHNYDPVSVRNVCSAANDGGASHVDIACDPELVNIAKSVCRLPICVSSIEPKLFEYAIASGADMIEIGNFDGFYPQGRQFTAEDIIALTKETRELYPTIPLSVTIPHTLSLPEQIQLAKTLELLEVDILQTEGKTSANVNPATMGVQQCIELAAPTLASAYALGKAVSIPVMCASGLTDITAPLALAAGARGVGVGSMIAKQPDVGSMYLAVRSIAEAMGRIPSHENNDEMVINTIQTKAGMKKVSARA